MMTSPIWGDATENAIKTRKLQDLVDAFDDSLDWSPRLDLFRDKYRSLPLPGEDFELRRNEDCSQVG